MALRVLPRLLYGDKHAYGKPLTGSGTEESVSKLTRDDLARFHATWFKPNNATLVVVGDTTLAEIQPRAREALRRVEARGGAEEERGRGARARPGRRSTSSTGPAPMQSVILAGQPAPPKANPDEIAIEAMNTILGGAFTSRLNMNLREDKHWSYGAGSFFFDARGPAALHRLRPGPDRQDQGIAGRDGQGAEGDRGDRPVTADELRFAKDKRTLTLSGRWETAGAVAGSLGEIVRFGYDDRYFETYAARVQALSLADVATATKLLEPDRMIWVVVGDRSKIEAPVRELNLGELRVIDADGMVR